MTPIEFLQQSRLAIPAQDIAEHLGQPIEEVYECLVAAEAAGQAEVRITFSQSYVLSREWAAKREATPA